MADRGGLRRWLPGRRAQPPGPEGIDLNDLRRRLVYGDGAPPRRLPRPGLRQRFARQPRRRLLALAGVASALLLAVSVWQAVASFRPPPPEAIALPAANLDAPLGQLPIWSRRAEEEVAELVKARRLIELGQLTSARELLEPLAPTSAEAAIALALVEERLGRPHKARELLGALEGKSEVARELLRMGG